MRARKKGTVEISLSTRESFQGMLFAVRADLVLFCPCMTDRSTNMFSNAAALIRSAFIYKNPLCGSSS
jgi:hypothetical protein